MSVIKKGDKIGIDADLVVKEIFQHNEHIYYIGSINLMLNKPWRDIATIPTIVFSLDSEVQIIPESVMDKAREILEKRVNEE